MFLEGSKRCHSHSCCRPRAIPPFRERETFFEMLEGLAPGEVSPISILQAIITTIRPKGCYRDLTRVISLEPV